MRENRLRLFDRYEERRFGSSKNSYEIKSRRKKRKGKTKEVVERDYTQSHSTPNSWENKARKKKERRRH